jgi:hypothetical protein
MKQAIGLFLLLFITWVLSGVVYEYFDEDCPDHTIQQEEI